MENSNKILEQMTAMAAESLGQDFKAVEKAIEAEQNIEKKKKLQSFKERALKALKDVDSDGANELFKEVKNFNYGG